jgi:Flp pilus assembly protein TadB
MNLDDLKAQWRTEMQPLSPPQDLKFEAIRDEVAEVNRGARFGDFWMIFALACGSALAVFFGWLTLDGVKTWQKLSIAANVMVTVWVIFWLLRARRTTRSDDWTLRSRLETEIERLEKHRNLWRYGALWVLAPMSVSVLLGLPARLYWVWFVMCAVVYWWARRETRKTLDPLLSRLKALHRELVEG